MTEPQKTPLDLAMALQNFESLWFNQFDVIPGQTKSITSVEVAWGTPKFPGSLAWMARR